MIRRIRQICGPFSIFGNLSQVVIQQCTQLVRVRGVGETGQGGFAERGLLPRRHLRRRGLAEAAILQQKGVIQGGQQTLDGLRAHAIAIAPDQCRIDRPRVRLGTVAQGQDRPHALGNQHGSPVQFQGILEQIIGLAVVVIGLHIQSPQFGEGD